MNRSKLIIGSRGSQLALWQADFIKEILQREHDCPAEVKIIKTTGDKYPDISFDKIEGKGFFTKELEEALLNREIDLAVHSLKDLMTSQPDGLKLGAVGFREDRREALLMHRDKLIGDAVLPIRPGCTIGTSSVRRKCQVAYHAPMLEVKDLRGNIPTRIRKLRDGEYDAIIIAAAGILRLGLDLSDLEILFLKPEQFLPAPAQGILGLQIRGDDKSVESIIERLNSPVAVKEASLERGLLARFNSGCSLPLGVLSSVTEDGMKLTAILGERSGENWTGLKKVAVSGRDTDIIIDEAYRKLTAE